MKCQACGYQYIRQSEVVDKVVRFKTGPRKGEIKEVVNDRITFEVGELPFVKLYFYKEVDTLRGNGQDIILYACPICNTIRAEYE